MGWVVESFSSLPDSFVVLWLLFLFGPVISIIANLNLQLPPTLKPNRTDAQGVVIWIVAILSFCTTFPFPWLWLAFMD